MPRKILIQTSDAPYHITNRSNNREFFYVDQRKLWEIFLTCFEELKVQFRCDIHAFVLMSNHYHLVISTPESNLGEAMKYLHREVARRANKTVDRINHFFGGRYKWTLISNELYYWNAIKYVFRNPVKAGLCEYVRAHEFSSIHIERREFAWQMFDPFSGSRNLIELDLEWLDQPFRNEQEVGIQSGLRRRTFSLPATAKKKPVLLDAWQYRKGTVTC